MQGKCQCVSLLILLCLISLSETITNAGRSEMEQEERTKPAALGDYCGYFNVTHKSNFIMYDRAPHNEDLADIIKSDLRKRIQYVNVNEGCEVLYCAPDLLNTTKQLRFCDRFTSFGDVTNYKYLYADTASCSCKQPTPGCSATKCEDVILDEGVCAQLYKESYCSLCRYDDPYVMRDNETIYPTNNSFSVDSLVVRDNCMLEINSDGIPPAWFKAGAYNSRQLAYAQNRRPAEFRCKCYDPDTPPSINSIGIVVVISSTLLVLLAVATAIGLNYYRVRKKMMRFLEDGIKRFTEGGTGGLHNNGFQSDDEAYARLRHYISMGYAEALRQPYTYQYEVSRDKLRIHEDVRLGEGNFGHVCLGNLVKANGESICVAVKIAKGSTNVIYFVSLLDEIKILAFIGSHPNIVCIEGTCTENIEQRDALLLLEYCSKGNLKNYLTRNGSSFLNVMMRNGAPHAEADVTSRPGYQSWSVTMQLQIHSTQIKKEWFAQFLKWSYEIANGMEYLSSKNVVHIDLAARNVLLTDDLTAKISDFGLSRRVQNVSQYARVEEDYGLPISWTALESLTSQRFTTESDVWSYGVTIWEIFSLGQEPYDELNFGFVELREYLSENKRLKQPDHATDDIYSEMCKCWLENSSQRPIFHELKDFFAKMLTENEGWSQSANFTQNAPSQCFLLRQT